ncbi:MAG: sigma-54-dependent Fis family transcriptional regulator [Deltaproteobacteria bacterium]|nr:sigma-54-dependent Fis family transcriptional regulator [Deltaproteobacteria bacterium]MBW2498436.1 sigma-54-dependent Fis family transcriptional regulator [Deltaproteobacteria bacterium]
MRILIADDEASIRFVLQEVLEELGHEIVAVEDGDAALRELASERFDLAFLDIRMPGLSGIEVLQQTRASGNDVAIVIITAQNLLENAVESMKAGALDYLVKPFAIAEVKALAEKALSTRALRDEVRSLRRAVGRSVTPGGDRMVGSSPALLEIFKTIGKVAPRNVPVLITGESGTGKELVARALHAASPRAEGPFIAVNAAAIPRELLESELFGHERGAFTGATSSRAGRFREAAGGTLFLDEIGDMPVELQAKLLRVLQSGEVMPVGGREPEHVDVRIVAATHRDLDDAVRKGEFREDLLYRLRVVPMSIPALRERPEDVRTLAHHFVERYAPELAEGPVTLPDRTIQRLERHDWPGNVRELENAIKRALVLATDDLLAPEEFDFLTRSSEPATTHTSLEELVIQEVDRLFEHSGEITDVYHRIQQRVERPLIEAVLERTQGNQIRAAALLGINRNTLRKKITELGIELPTRG